MSDALPPCGLYRTVVAHPGRAEQVPAKRLIYFHNHSSGGTPIVLLPKSNAGNRWTFNERGYSVSDVAWCRSLVEMRPEGFYTVGESFGVSGDRTVVEGQIVQLGYNGNAEPILFFPKLDPDTNALVFPTQGMKALPAVYAALRPVDIRGPHTPGRPGGVH